MDIDYSASLEHELPDEAVGHSFIDVAAVNRGLLVLFPTSAVRFLLDLCAQTNLPMSSARHPDC
jgi:hypothetical protein